VQPVSVTYTGPGVTNNGTITGFVQFTGSNNSIVNNGEFDLRNFPQNYC
jgi:hypothetical protein